MINTRETATKATSQSKSGSCHGIPSTDWSCCSSTSPCDIGGGDCDNDSDCAESLKCGHDNCIDDFPFGNWNKQADCCFGEYDPLYGLASLESLVRVMYFGKCYCHQYSLTDFYCSSK